MKSDKLIEELKKVDIKFDILTTKMEKAGYDEDMDGMEAMLLAMMALTKKSQLYAKYFDIPPEYIPKVSKQ